MYVSDNAYQRDLQNIKICHRITQCPIKDCELVTLTISG